MDNFFALIKDIIPTALAVSFFLGIIFVVLAYKEIKEDDKYKKISENSAKNFTGLCAIRPEEIIILQNISNQKNLYFTHYVNQALHGPFKQVKYFPLGIIAITDDSKIIVYHADQDLNLQPREYIPGIV